MVVEDEKSWMFYFNIWTCTTVSESIVSFAIILCPCRPWHQRYNIIQFTRAKLDCSRRLTFFCNNLSQARDDDRVTHIVLQGIETNGIRVLRRLNSIEGYVQTYVLLLLRLFGRIIAISSAELENASASPPLTFNSFDMRLFC